MLKKILNKNGSISPVAFLLFFLILTFVSVHIANNLLSLKKLKFRNNAYLCTKTVINDLEKYYKSISSINKAITTAFYLQFAPIPAVSAGAKNTHKLLILSQNILHISQMKNLGDKKFCDWKNTLNIVITPPVEMKNSFIPKRNKDGSMEIKEIWTNQIVFKAKTPLNILKDSLSIRITLKKQSSLLSDSFNMTSKEVSLKSNSLVGF